MSRLARLGVAVAALDGSVTLAQQATFRVTTTGVALDVAVSIGTKPVTDLTAADFEVLDNGVAQSVSEVTRETLPIDVTLVVDASASVRGFVLSSLLRALDGVGERLRQGDAVRLVTFNDRVVMREWTPVTSAPKLSEALGRPSGQTSLLNALAVSLIERPRPERRQMAIVFTDGHDTVSTIDEAAVTEVAKHSDPAIFVVALARFPPGFRQPALPHTKLLKELASLTGGWFAQVQANSELGGAFIRAFDDFRTSYVVRYNATGVSPQGWHELTVRVKRPGKFDIRARKGYGGAVPQ